MKDEEDWVELPRVSTVHGSICRKDGEYYIYLGEGEAVYLGSSNPILVTTVSCSTWEVLNVSNHQGTTSIIRLIQEQLNLI